MARRGGCGDCGDCGGEYEKNKEGWTPVRYYIMYVMDEYIGADKWKLINKVELLKNATNEKQAEIEAGKWLRKMKRMEEGTFHIRLSSAKLVASTHKDILRLT